MNSLKRRLEIIEQTRPAKTRKSIMSAESTVSERDKPIYVEQLEKLLAALSEQWPDRIKAVCAALVDPEKYLFVMKGLGVENRFGLIGFYFEIMDVMPKLGRETAKAMLADLVAGNMTTDANQREVAL